MKRKEIKSSNLKSVGYNEDTKVLEVEFHNGDIYMYLDVPKYKFDNLTAAGSKGKYFNKSIRSKFKYEKVDKKEEGQG